MSVPSFATSVGVELVGRDVEQAFHWPGNVTCLGCKNIIVIARYHIRRLEFKGNCVSLFRNKTLSSFFCMHFLSTFDQFFSHLIKSPEVYAESCAVVKLNDVPN